MITSSERISGTLTEPVACNSQTTTTTEINPIGLTKISGELLSYIVQYLDLADLSALRQSCKALQRTIKLRDITHFLVKKYYGHCPSLLQNVRSKSSDQQARFMLTDRLEPLILNYKKQFPSVSLMEMAALLRNISNRTKPNIQTKCITLTMNERGVKIVEGVNGILPLQNGELISWYKSLTIWSVEKFGDKVFAGCVRTLTGYNQEIENVFQLENEHLVSCYEGAAKIWDVRQRQGEENLRTFFTPSDHSGSIKQLADECFISHSGANELQVWNLAKPHHQEFEKKLHTNDNCWIQSIIPLKNKCFTLCIDDGTLQIWNFKKPVDQQCIKTLYGHETPVRYVRELNDEYLVSSAYEKVLRVWSLQEPTGKECVRTLKGHLSCVEGFIILRDGRLASFSLDCTIKVWNLTKPAGHECVKTLTGHSDIITCLIELEDGRLASSSNDTTLKIWDLTQPPGKECVKTLQGHDKPVSGIKQLSNWFIASYDS
ncbi:MAG: hypothetical protein OXD32_02715, partial [Endozoicomonadaceae bacterium]|nr:hypothetical protein [Endozoicomonadaceae bacterium]